MATISANANTPQRSDYRWYPAVDGVGLEVRDFGEWVYAGMVTEDRGKRTQWFYETRGGDPIRVLDRVDYSGGGTGVLRIASMDEAKRRLLKVVGAEGEERV